MKRFWLSAGLFLMCGSLAAAQTTGSNAPAANAPEGTHVTRQETESIVQPTSKAVAVTPSVIKSAQQKLAAEGFDPGAADGRMGPKTHAAIRQFQSKHGLKENGGLDQPTLSALDVGAGQELKAAPSDIGRGGKAFGHDVEKGHPVAAGEALASGSKNFGTKVGQGTKSEAVTVKKDVGKGLSKLGKKVEGKSAAEPQKNPPQ